MTYSIFSPLIRLVMLLVLFGLTSGCSLYQPTTFEESSQDNHTPTLTTDNEGSQAISADAELDLSNQHLQRIPVYVFEMQDLQELDVSNNQLTGAIQAEIRHLSKLKILNASNNQMTGVPAEIGQLHQLEVLNLANNQLTGLPYELGNLKNLQVLDISGNAYSEADLNKIKEALPASVRIIK